MSTQPGPSFRTHQKQLLAVVRAIAAGADVADILAAVAPGAGKSLLPPIAASVLLQAGLANRIIWACPRDSLKEQAAEAFADPYWRDVLGHALSVRAAENAPDPSRGLAGYVTTYQAIAAAPDLHLAEVRKHPTILVLDEAHHLPALSEAPEPGRDDQEQSWSTAVLPLLECARIRILLSGTIERADGRKILWLPYRRGQRASQAEIDLDAPGWAVIGYSRAQALAERAVLPVTFAAYDGQARWLEPVSRQADGSSTRLEAGPHRLYNAHPTETTRPAIFTALRTGFADTVLRRAFEATRNLRAERRALGIEPIGLGKLLVVAPDQAQARRYLAVLRSWMPPGKQHIARICVSDERDSHETLAYYRLKPHPSILVSVAMAAEGFDAKSVAVIAALTHIRSRPWLEQMIARATRVDPNAGPYEAQRALVLHPDDPFFGIVRRRM